MAQLIFDLFSSLGPDSIVWIQFLCFQICLLQTRPI